MEEMLVMSAGERKLAFKGTLPNKAAWKGDRTIREKVNGGEGENH